MEDKEEHLKSLLQSLNENEGKLSKKDKEKRVMVEKAINLRLMCDYVVSCSYGDIVLVICMLHDYVKMLDETRGNEITWQFYYRERFIKMADKLSRQIGYNYGLAAEKCNKKIGQKQKCNDVGEDAMMMAVKGWKK